MNYVFTYSFYGITAVLFGISFVKDRKKTALSLKRAGKMFINILPQFMAILLIIGLLLVVAAPETIRRVIGVESGFAGMALASLFGSVALIPVLIVFPIAAELLESGAGIPQIVVLISTMTMVGLITLPIEIKYFGKKAALLRSALAFLFAFLTALAMGAVL